MRVIICFGVICLFAACPNACYRITHGFRPAKCTLHWPDNPEWENEPLGIEKSQEVQAILGQRFSYFAKGKQCFVFISQDGKHVLKLFRFDACKIPYGQKIAHRIKKWRRGAVEDLHPLATVLPKVMNSCKMAYTKAAPLTGLVYIHLNPKRGALPILRIKDRLGRTHHLDPADYRFILQKKCDPLMPTLIHATPKERERLLSSFSLLIHRLGDLGLKNIDPRLSCNFGFINGEAMALDVGNFIHDPARAKEDAAIFIPRLHRSLQNKLELKGRL